MIASNARQIIALREQGKHPASWVLVSFIGRAGHEDNGFTVYASPDREYDWRWIVGLDVIAFVRKGAAVATSLRAMRNEQPKSLSLWDVDVKAGAQVNFRFPETAGEAQRKFSSKSADIELMPWFGWQTREFVRMGF